MKVRLELSRQQLERLVVNHFREKLGEMAFDEKKIKIETKSSQNYRSEWESADFRAVYESFDEENDRA